MLKQQIPLSIKKVENSVTNTIKIKEERKLKLKKAIHTYISDNNICVITDAQIHQDNKNYDIYAFADMTKTILENKIKQFPIFPVEIYVELFQEYRKDDLEIKDLISKRSHLKYLNESELRDRIHDSELMLSKSIQQAEEFLTHKLFKTEDNNYVRVVYKRQYEVTDATGKKVVIIKKMLDPGITPIRLYEDTLNKMPLEGSFSDKNLTYWDIYSQSSSVLYAKTIYNPQGSLYYSNHLGHFFINSYIEPEWKKEPDHYYLMQRHKKKPITFNDLSPPLRAFLTHLFPGEANRKEVLKWCAFSLGNNLQTFLTLIGYRGIGKGLFVEDFLGYYHGKNNLNKPKDIEEKFDAKNSNSTLLYFDELQMVTLNQYNIMKLFTNDTLNYQEKNQAIYTTTNYANVVWSCNTKDTMSAMSREDRRFKIVPLATVELLGIKILDDKNQEIGEFTSDYIKEFKDDLELKREFVLLMWAIKDYVIESKESLNDINTVSENDSRDKIFEESRSMDFTEIIDTVRNVFDDYNPITNKYGRNPTADEKDKYGTPYKDHIPLSKITKAKNDNYTYRVPYSIVRKVLTEKSGKGKPMSLRAFNKHLDNMPLKTLKSYITSGQMRDIEIRLNEEIETLSGPELAHDLFQIKHKAHFEKK